MEVVDTEDEDFLSLSLAIVAADSCTQKRKRTSLNPNHSSSDFESKIFQLLRMRDQMIKHETTKQRNDVVEEKQNDNKGLHLIHLLLITATAVDENNRHVALSNLIQLYRSVSLTGDSVQRVVAYFSDGLTARLLTKNSPFYQTIMKPPPTHHQFAAFTDLYKVSPYFQFAHFTANQVIIEAFEREESFNNRALHVIDFDVSYGFQWPSLIQSLSEKATSANRISLQITGFGTNKEELQETETRLTSFAKGFRNLVFEFHGIIEGDTILYLLKKKKRETIAVNLVFHLNTLNHISKVSHTLKSIYTLNPSVIVLVEQEGTIRPKSFLSRFMESLHYFAAMFDSLDDCLPSESRERLGIERNHLGKEIKGLINHDYYYDYDGLIKKNKEETWKMRMESHGFEGIKISSKCLIQAKLLLKIRTSSHYCGDGSGCGGDDQISGFRVFEKDDGRAISLGWQDRCLLSASAWRCV